jgi:hypothetical protein
MKKTLALILMALTLTVTLAVSSFAANYVLDFTSEGVNGEGAYAETAGEFALTLEKQPKAAVATLDGVEFEAKTNSAWGLITLTEQSKYNEAGLNGIGVKLRYDNGVEVTVMQPGESWGHVAIASYRVHADKTFNDNNYHKIAIAKVDGKWSITVDGLELLGDNLNADQHAVVDTLLSGAAYVSFGGNSYDDACTVKSAEVKVEEPAPEEPAPETADPMTLGLVITAVAASAAIVAGKKRR